MSYIAGHLVQSAKVYERNFLMSTNWYFTTFKEQEIPDPKAFPACLKKFL